MSYLNACGMARGTQGRCYMCDGELPARRRRWCSDACSLAFEGNHYWNVARWVALKAADNRCVRCGSDGRVATGRCSCYYGKWPCARAGEPLHEYDEKRIHEQRFDRVLEVNHIVPRNGRGYTPGCHHHQANLEVLCRPCHVQETRRQGLGRRLAAALRIAEGVKAGRLILVPREVRQMRPHRTPEAVPMSLWDLAS